MMGPISLYRRLVGFSIRSQLQYRTSFVLHSIAHLFVTGGEFLGIWALFARFGSLGGWTLAEVCVFYGLVNAAFAIADSITEGFDQLGSLVRRGEFDRMLLRPRSPVLLLLGYEFTARRVGRFSQGLAVLGYGLVSSGQTARLVAAGAGPGVVAASVLASGLLIVWAAAGLITLFLGLRILQACLSFKTVETLEIMNVFTYGGVSTASYPFTIFTRWFRMTFTLVIPIAAVSYYPGLVLLGRADPLGAPIWIGWITPLAGPAFLALSLLAWRAALRWYNSTGT